MSGDPQTKVHDRLDQGLAALAREMVGGRLQRATAAIGADLQAGKPLAEALQRQAGRVPAYYGPLLSAGMRSGRSGDVLLTMASYTRACADLRATILAAFIYPGLVLAVGFGIIVLGTTFIVPSFEKIYSDFKMRLPWLTDMAINVSHHRLYFILPPLLLIAFVLTIRFLLRLTARGQRIWARWLYALPVAGTLIRSARLASFTDLLAILVEYEVPLAEAIRLAGAACLDPVTEATSRQIEQDLERGVPLATAFREQQTMPEVVTFLASRAQERGNLPATLRHVAELYRRQAELRAAVLRTVIPPFFVIATAAAVIGIMVLAMFAPLMGLLEGLSGR